MANAISITKNETFFKVLIESRFKYALVIARCPVQYDKHFSSFSYFSVLIFWSNIPLVIYNIILLGIHYFKYETAKEIAAKRQMREISAILHEAAVEEVVYYKHENVFSMLSYCNIK